MRKDTTFSDRKLTAEEFSDKYWMHGQFPYQYHTGTIEDGRDEREQFVFNNIRALWERMNYDADHQLGRIGWQEYELQREIEALKAEVQDLRAKIMSLDPANDGRNTIEEGNGVTQSADELAIKISYSKASKMDVKGAIIASVHIE